MRQVNITSTTGSSHCCQLGNNRQFGGGAQSAGTALSHANESNPQGHGDDGDMPESHTLAVIRLGIFHYAACSCRSWVSEAQDTIQQAQAIDCCPYEPLDVEARRNLAAFRRAAVSEARIERDFPRIVS